MSEFITLTPVRKWEVQTRMFSGWENCWSEIDNDGNEAPWYFDSESEAWLEIDQFLKDIHEAVVNGDMDEDYDPEDYRVAEVLLYGECE